MGGNSGGLLSDVEPLRMEPFYRNLFENEYPTLPIRWHMNYSLSQALWDFQLRHTLNYLASNISTNKILLKPPKSSLENGRFIKHK